MNNVGKDFSFETEGKAIIILQWKLSTACFFLVSQSQYLIHWALTQNVQLADLNASSEDLIAIALIPPKTSQNNQVLKI